MARLKIAYIGGGSTRAPGTMKYLITKAADFAGSEIVLIDLNEEHTRLVQQLSQKMVREAGADLTISVASDRLAGLADCDAVLTSFRPGGFEARYLDESIPLKYGVIGQETQGPGGFFMALRTVNAMKGIVRDIERVAPNARILNYTNPINIVSEAVAHHSSVPIVSVCEGPIVFPRWFATRIGLDADKLEAPMIGLNHACWSTSQRYDGQEFLPLLAAGYENLLKSGTLSEHDRRLMRIALTMGSLPAHYFQYYYFTEEILGELQRKPTTRAQDIMAAVPGNWEHYRQQAQSAAATHLDPTKSRSNVEEVKLAIDVINAIFNDRKQVWTCNVPNAGGIADFADDLVVEVPCLVDRNGATPITSGRLPGQGAGLVKMLGEYQALTAQAAWSGNRTEAIRALSSHPFITSVDKAEAMYDEMSRALRHQLPSRLLRG